MLAVMRIHFDNKSLNLFVQVAHCGSISQAARQSHLALAAASKRIAELEALVGSTLLVRHARGVKLTDAGTMLLAHAHMILSAIGALELDVLDRQHGVQGLVRIGANASSIAQFLPQSLGSFLRAHPGLRVDLTELSSLAAIQRLRSGEVDLAVFEAQSAAFGLETRFYQRDQLALIVSRHHRLGRRKRVTAAEVFADEHIALAESTALARMLQGIAQGENLNWRVRVRVGSFDAACRLVEQRLGVAVLPFGAIEPQLASLELHSVRIDMAWGLREHRLGARHFSALSPAAALLADHLTQA